MASGGKQRGLIIIVVALVLIAILGVAYFVLSSRGTNILAPAGQQAGGAAAPAPSAKMTSIVITTQKIPRGSIITEGVITTLAYPEKDLVPGTFFTNPKDVINKQAKFDLEPRMPITQAMLVTGQAGVGSYAAFQIPKGFVAVSMPINRLSAVSFAPVIGDHVNIIASILVVDIDQEFQSKLPNNTSKLVPAYSTEADPGSLTANTTLSGVSGGRVQIDSTINAPTYLIPSEPQRPRLVSQMVIQDAIILRMGNFPTNEIAKTSGVEPTAQPAAADNNQAAPTPSTPDIMTLIVRPQDAITLNYLQQTGAKLSLALRSAGDIDPAAVEAVTLQYLFQTYNIPNPPKTNFSIEPRLDNLPTSVPAVARPTAVPAQ
jgi:Flp pilus assembly protein CpaB